MTTRRKLLMIGLDAGDRDFLATHAADLPNISALLDRASAQGVLDADPMAGSVWPTFYTRSRPMEHGIFHHLQWDPQQMRVRRTAPSWAPARPFWRDLGERGVRVVAFDVPFVFPGLAANVVEVINWGSHDLAGPLWSSVPGLARRIRARYGLHPMGFEVPVIKTSRQRQRLLDGIVRGTGVKRDVTLALMRDHPWDLFVVAFGEPHRGGHTIWPLPEEADQADALDGVLRIYKAVDEAVGAVVAEAGPDANVILFAPHGMGPNSSQSHLTSVFVQRAIARFRGRPAPEEQGDAPGLIRALRRSVPSGLQLAIANAVPLFVRDQVVAREIAGGFRWDDTYGFCLHGDLAGYLRLNVKGREAKGVLTEEEAARLRLFIRDELEALRTPEGRPIVKAVSFPAAGAVGERRRLLPDILVEWDPDLRPVPVVVSPNLGTIRAQPATGRGGNHNFRGFYAYAGPSPSPAARPRHLAELADLVEALV